MNVTITELKDSDITFSNDDGQHDNVFTIELSHSDVGTGRSFFLWVNGQLKHTFTTLSSLNRKANELVSAHSLERLEA